MIDETEGQVPTNLSSFSRLHSMFQVCLTTGGMGTPRIQIVDYKMGSDVGSDHFPLIIDFTLVATVPGDAEMH